jgi:serine/threonine-protein kinase PknG
MKRYGLRDDQFARIEQLLPGRPGYVGRNSEKGNRLFVEAVIEDLLKQAEDFDAFDWRPQWLRAQYLLTQNRGKEARDCFEQVYFAMPGELAPRLAMGFAAEMANDLEQALPYYDRVGRVDPGMITAHFGAARCHARLGQLKEGVVALDRVPENHALHVPTQLAIGQLLLLYPDQLNIGLLKRAEAAMKVALQQGGQAFQVAGRLFELALASKATLGWPMQENFLDHAFDDAGLRAGAEENYRKAAHEAINDTERYNWIGHRAMIHG